MEELKEELSELEPELKGTQEEGQRLTHALAQQRTQVTQIRDQMVALEERVKASHFYFTDRKQEMHDKKMNTFQLHIF